MKTNNKYIIYGEPAIGFQEINAVVHENAEALGGSFSAEHGIGSKLKNELVRFSDPIKIELMKKIKKSLDPKNIMNPDKLIDP